MASNEFLNMNADLLGDSLLTECVYKQFDDDELIVIPNFVFDKFRDVYDSFCNGFSVSEGNMRDGFIAGETLLEIFKHIYKRHYKAMESDQLAPFESIGMEVNDDLMNNVYLQLFSDFLNHFHSYFRNEFSKEDRLLVNVEAFMLKPFKEAYHVIGDDLGSCLMPDYNSFIGFYHDNFNSLVNNLGFNFYDYLFNSFYESYKGVAKKFTSDIYLPLFDKIKDLLNIDDLMIDQLLEFNLDPLRVGSLINKIPKEEDILSNLEAYLFDPIKAGVFNNYLKQLAKLEQSFNNLAKVEMSFSITPAGEKVDFYSFFNTILSPLFDSVKPLIDSSDSMINQLIGSNVNDLKSLFGDQVEPVFETVKKCFFSFYQSSVGKLARKFHVDFNELIGGLDFSVYDFLVNSYKGAFLGISSNLNNSVYAPLVKTLNDWLGIHFEYFDSDSLMSGFNDLGSFEWDPIDIKYSYTYQGKSLLGFIEYLGSKQNFMS